MNYDWENIFKEKSNKELFSIYCGDTMLHEDAIFYAKKELENRNFDFKNIDGHRKGWRLTNLMNEDKRETDLYNSHKHRVLPNKFYFIISFILLAYVTFICIKDFEKNFKTSVFLTLMFIASFITDNIYSKTYVRNRRKRIAKIKELKTLALR